MKDVILCSVMGSLTQLTIHGMYVFQYNFQWRVDDEEYQNYYGQQETGLNNRVDGSYYVWLPDNRLMRVTYYVEGDSGFVPTITYEENYQPNWGTPGFVR